MLSYQITSTVFCWLCCSGGPPADVLLWFHEPRWALRYDRKLRACGHPVPRHVPVRARGALLRGGRRPHVLRARTQLRALLARLQPPRLQRQWPEQPIPEPGRSRPRCDWRCCMFSNNFSCFLQRAFYDILQLCCVLSLQRLHMILCSLQHCQTCMTLDFFRL